MKYIAEDNKTCAIKAYFVRLSECEIDVYESILDFIVTHYNNEFIEKFFGETSKDELAGMRDSIRYTILKYFDKIDLPDRAKDWNYKQCEEAAEY
ncbi:MAG: hypothetical protein LBJ67_00575 [Planctomycetaceae bacterium]|jgi:hypothetical protein|nr:hypothetical protein [Planctomycetaceae bacterium]